MKLTNSLIFFKLFLTALAIDTGDLSDEEMSHATAHGIFRSILTNRDFGSHVVKFSEWESPTGDLYVVPSTEEDESNIPALGLGYKFVNNDESVVQSMDISDIAQIKEENITAAGFPKLWKKHSEEETADDYFPFGSKKFMMIGLNKQSVDNEESSVEEAGLFNWFDEEDDCNADKKTNKLFDTDHFLFVGVGSVDGNVVDYDDNIEDKKWEKYDSQSLKIITSYTTTTITSIHEITITETDHPALDTNLVDIPEKKISEPTTIVDHYPGEENPTTQNNLHTEIVTSTHKPFIFSTTVDELSPTVPSETNIEVVQTETNSDLETSYPVNTVYTTENSLSTFETVTYSETKDNETPIVKTSVTTTEIESWIIPTTWESYPFSAPDIKTTELHYYNTTVTESSFQNLKTSSIGGNTTSRARTKNGSIYTRVNGTNSSTVATSQNFGNIQRSYVGSLFGLVFAFVSGVILI